MAGKIPQDAFQFYVSLGPERSYQRVAEEYGVSKRAVTRHATKEAWQSRLGRIEEEARKRGDEGLVETIEQMNDRHFKLLRVVQGKAIETLKSMPLGSAMDAVRALDIVLRQERTIRGEPTDRTAVSIEDTIRREYERWLEPEEVGDVGVELESEAEVTESAGDEPCTDSPAA